MKDKKKLRLKKFYLHPITSYIFLCFITIILSFILSSMGVQASYNAFDDTKLAIYKNTVALQPHNNLVVVENLLSYEGFKFIISDAAKNFISFTTLSTLLISLIGVSVAESSGLISAFVRKHAKKMSSFQITFILIFLATISSIINDVGYTILIPLGALLFLETDRNPLVGIISAFSGIAFGYGVTIFSGSFEINTIPYTEASARLLDSVSHVPLLGNIFIIIFSTIIISIVGTIVIRKLIEPNFGKYRERVEIGNTILLDKIDHDDEVVMNEVLEKKGLKRAAIASLIVILIFIYSIIPNLPGSGLLLDMNEFSYTEKLFGTNAYFTDGFTYMVSILFLVAGIAYGFGAKTFKNDKDIISKSSHYLSNIGELIITIFFASQFIAIFKKSNIGTVITAWGVDLITSSGFSGVPLIILCLLIVAVSGLFITTPVAKWKIIAPVMVPALMQSNVSPAFIQFIFRAGDSISKGFSPLLAFFVIYIGYLNLYNPKKDKPIGIRQAIKYLIPYGLIIGITWIILIIGWYFIGLPLGPNIYPTV